MMFACYSMTVKKNPVHVCGCCR